MSKRIAWSVVVLYLAAAAAVAVPPGVEVSPLDQEALESMEPLGATPCVGGMAGPYPCENVDLLAYMPLAAMNCGGGNDIWGWTDPLTSKEYALMGCRDRTSFVDISDPTNPLFLGWLPSHTSQSTWRDIKVYEDHAFVVSDFNGSHGMQVFDLTRLRNVPSPPMQFTEDAWYNTNGMGSAHNLAINEDTGFAYVVGADHCLGGLHIVNIQNPTSPTYAGCFDDDDYTHDVQCVIYHGPDAAHFGKEICVASNEDTVTMVDVTNKSAPVQLAREEYPGSAYTHQGWLTEDHRFFLLDDELDEQFFGHNTRTRVWDVTDLDNPVIIGFYDSPAGAIDHNQYVKGNYVYQSNYRAGLRILDLSGIDDGTLTQAGFFDVYPANDLDNFNGTWSNYPYFESGVVIASSMDTLGGLYILQPTLEQTLPKLSVSDAAVDEGDVAPVEIEFQVSLSAATDGLVTVDYQTEDGTAVAGVDYVAASGTLEIPAGEVVGSIPVQILPNNDVQDDRSFVIHLSNPQGATVAEGTATGTILDDDSPVPGLTLNDPFAQEGDGDPVSLGFVVSLAFPTDVAVSFDYQTVDGTAVAGEDYVATSGTATVEPGGTTAPIEVPVLGNFIPQVDRTLSLEISSPVNATIDDSSGGGTILDDDAIEHEDMDPSSGPAAGGGFLVLHGQNFLDGVEVEFGATPATEVEIVSETTLVAVPPPLAAGELFEVHVFYGEQGDAAPQLHPQHLRFLADYLDAPRSHIFHDAVEILRRQDLTGGCGNGLFCIDDTLTRGQMAPLLLTSFFGGSYEPPACVEGAELFADVPFSSPFCRWIEDLASRGITAGCGGGNYCPGNPVSRDQMAVFLLKTLEGTGYTPPACTSVFDDVPCPSLFANWIEELASRGITGGCAADPPRYCPAAGVLRGQMAVFLVEAFAIPFTW